jgi:two-component system, response regulator PdtaR
MSHPAAPVLLVEDDPLILDCTAEMLIAGGCEVIRATNAHEALAVLENGPVPPTVVTDISLAEGGESEDQSGLDLARLIAERWPSVRLLIVSGAHRPARDQYPEQAIFFTKPYAQGALLALVKDGDW